MRFNFTKHKRQFAFLLAPYIICAIVGIFIGIITNEKFPQYSIVENILIWMINLIPGVMAHQMAFFWGYYVFEWKFSPTVRGTWKQNLLGIFLTFLLVLIVSPEEIKGAVSLFRLFFQVAGICIIIYLFLFLFKFYHTAEKIFSETLTTEDETKKNGEEPSDFLKLESNEKIEKINLNLISHITVKDHYCTVVYYKDNEWRHSTLYGKLKNFEQKYAYYLLRINRSTLVNPKMVEKIEKIDGKYFLSMKADYEPPFPISSSQKHHLNKLVPEIS